MALKNMEYTLNSFFNVIREKLEERFWRETSNIAVSVSELVASSFSYVATRVLSGKLMMPKTSGDLFKQLASKAKCLLKDEFRSQKCEHGRKSVRAQYSLDYVINEGEQTLADFASVKAYHDRTADDEHAYRCSLLPRVFQLVLDDMHITRKNREIVSECMLGGVSRETVAKRYGTTRGNVDILVCRCMKGLSKYGSKHYRALYEAAA